MIHFEIIQSPDNNVMTKFQYFQNQVYIGSNSGDLWINDRELLTSHAILEVVGKELIIHPQKNVEFYLINGKRASAVKKLKINDQLTLGKTIIQILEFSEDLCLTKKQILDQKLNKLIEENSLRLPIIESLTKLMK